MAITLADEQRALSSSDGASRLIAFATASHARAIAFLVVASLIAFLPGFFRIPTTDRDEARFAQATKQMLESGDYIDIRYQDDVRYKKPVGIYWLQAGVVKAAEALGMSDARTTIWLYRIPSLTGAVGAVLLTYWAALPFASRRYAYLAALMLATSLLLGIEARIAKTDAMLLLAVVAAMGALARAYVGPAEAPDRLRGWLVPAVFWTALAGGVLLKGPVIVLVIALACASLVVFDRSLSWMRALRPALGLLWLAVLVVPWFVAIVGRAGESFFIEAVGRDMLAKVATGQESHGAPPGYYLLLFWISFWPAAPLAALAAPSVLARWREPHTRFLLAWLLPTWLVFELVVTKLPHYVLPLYPAIAILSARAMEQGALATNPWLRRATIWWPLVAIVAPIVAVIGLLILRRNIGLIAWPFAAGAMIFGFFAWRQFASEGAERSFVRAATAAILVAIAVFGVIVPLLRPLFPSVALARIVAASDCQNPAVAAAGYHEPSLVFLVGTSTRLIEGAGAADFLSQGPCRFALIELRQERAFVHRAEAIGLHYTARGRFDGINTNGGRPISIAIYRSGGAP